MTCLLQVDYIGIGLNATGSALLTYYFTGTRSFYRYFGSSFVPLNFLLGVGVCISCGLSKLIHLRPKSQLQILLKLGVCGIHILYGFSPFIYRLVECAISVPTAGSLSVCIDDECFRIHFGYVTCFFAAVFFYASHLPEWISPGSFDLFGYGHGIFHVIMTATSLLQFDAALCELKRRPDDLVRLASPSWTIITGGILLVIFADVIFIVITQGARITIANGVASEWLSQDNILRCHKTLTHSTNVQVLLTRNAVEKLSEYGSGVTDVVYRRGSKIGNS